MNKLYRMLIQTFIVSIITIATMNAHAGAKGNEDGVPAVGTRNDNHGVIPPHARIQGKTYGDWGAEWWKWAFSVPFAQSPIMDLDGTDGSRNQHGAVWFLAGTFGTFAERSITIPSGKFIFFPLVNTENDYPCPDPNFRPSPGQSLEDFLTLGVAPYFDSWITDPNKIMSAMVDKDELINLVHYRGTSKLTKFTADPSQIAMDPCITGTEQKMVSDGYWIMLAPLKRGKHEIEFSAYDTSNPSWALHVIYHVTISR
jgi:hypothetical protein